MIILALWFILLEGRDRITLLNSNVWIMTSVNCIRPLHSTVLKIIVFQLFLWEYIGKLILEDLCIIMMCVSVLSLKFVQRILLHPSLVELNHVSGPLNIEFKGCVQKWVVFGEPDIWIFKARFLYRRKKLIKRILTVHYSLVDRGWITSSTWTVLLKMRLFVKWFLI